MEMRKIMRAGKTVFLIMCICMLGLAACGERTDEEMDDDAAVSSISLKKDGSISSKIVEDFQESDYDMNGLKSMIETSIEEYKLEDAEANITLKSCKVENGFTNVQIEFDNFNSYAGFNNEHFFAGTIQGANQAGFDLDVTLNAASDNSENATVSKPELLGMGSNHIVILELEKPEEGQEVQPIRVNCFDEILYVGDGVTVVGKKSADVSLAEGYGIIVFK